MGEIMVNNQSISLIGIVVLAALFVGCGAIADPYSDYTIEEQFILRGLCQPDCSITHFDFDAASPSGERMPNALIVEVSPRDTEGFQYCINYFDNQSCGQSDLIWNQVSAAALLFPCGTHVSGFLIRAERGDFAEEGGFTLPSYWLAYKGGQVAAVEGETADELAPMFNCEADET